MPRQYPPDPMAFARLLNTNRRQRRHEPLPTLTRLLKTESKLEFASIRDALSCAGKPSNAVQEVYFQEVIYFVWEFLHFQRLLKKFAVFLTRRKPDFSLHPQLIEVKKSIFDNYPQPPNSFRTNEI